MKQCPFCSEEIQEEAIKCRHCRSILTKVSSNEIGGGCNAPSPKEFGWLVPVSIVLILVFWAAANYKQSSPNPTAAEQSSNSPEASYTLSADSLYREYEENEVAADAKYKGRVIIVSGIIQDIGKDFTDTAYVILAVEGLFGVHCMYAKGEEFSVAQLSKGQQITIKGVVSGKMIGNVVIQECKQVLEEEERPNQRAIQSQQDEPNFISVNGQVVPNPQKQQNQSTMPEPSQTADVNDANKIKEYYPNGNLKAEKTFRNGKIEGEVKEYYDSGEIQWITIFKDDKPNGVLKEFFKSGKLRMEETLQNGRLEGMRKTYYESGALRSTDYYNDGFRNGPWERYFENGDLFWKWNYLNGKWDSKNDTAIFKNKKDGLTKFFFGDKSLAYEANIKNGKVDGLLKEYYRNGNVSDESNFVDGVPDGTYKEYDENGSLVRNKRYSLFLLTARLMKIIVSGFVGMAG